MMWPTSSVTSRVFIGGDPINRPDRGIHVRPTETDERAVAAHVGAVEQQMTRLDIQSSWSAVWPRSCAESGGTTTR